MFKMPEKSMAFATYALGASLVAILVYVIGPSLMVDSETNTSGKAGGGKTSPAGLVNSANDCFINSVLQALASLPEMRRFLYREIHRRSLDPEIYRPVVVSRDTRGLPPWKIAGLQQGLVTKALEDMLAAMSNASSSRNKSLSTHTFIKNIELAFRQKVSRQQQDAHEFLQIVAQRLLEEYCAAQVSRKAARRRGVTVGNGSSKQVPTAHGQHTSVNGVAVTNGTEQASASKVEESVQSIAQESATDPQVELEYESLGEDEDEDEDELDKVGGEEDGGPEDGYGGRNSGCDRGFPMKGTYKAQIECMTCHFKPTPSESIFCVLTLNVPQYASTSLSSCLDGMFKREEIDDYKCEKCRLLHAIQLYEQRLAQLRKDQAHAKDKPETSATTSNAATNAIHDLEDTLSKLRLAVEVDPEKPPEGIELPKGDAAPSRRIERHTYMTRFPRILAIHLSRSIFSVQASRKNSAKVPFPAALKLGSLTYGMAEYRLAAVVTHEGSHSSGHYETFRRHPIAMGSTATEHLVPTPSSLSSSPKAALRYLNGSRHNREKSQSRPSQHPPSPTPSSQPQSQTRSSSPSLTSVVAVPLPDKLTPLLPPHSSSSLQLPATPPKSPANLPGPPDEDQSSLKSAAASALSRFSTRFSSSSNSTNNTNTSSSCTAATSGHNSVNGCISTTATTTSTTTSTSTSTTSSTTTPPALPSSTPSPTPISHSSSTSAPTMISFTNTFSSPRDERRRKKDKDKDKDKHKHKRGSSATVPEKWWRTSDEKVKETRIASVLDMQKEVYLLFYEQVAEPQT